MTKRRLAPLQPSTAATKPLWALKQAKEGHAVGQSNA